jgi:phenylpyruvate tautomerase PptA (4-oxalocrotonate tautomerase family)
MPNVDIELVTRTNGTVAMGLAQSLADAVGRALDSPTGRTWVRLHVLAPEHYAENGSPPGMSDLPVFVTVLKHSTPAAPELEAEVSALTDVVATVLGRASSSVHIEYAPAARGRLAFGFGGKLVE